MEAEAIISSPVVIVPVVLLVSLILIVIAVVCFIKIKRSNETVDNDFETELCSQVRQELVSLH